MKKMFFLLLLLPVSGFAQSSESIAAFLKSRPTNLGQLISMPERSYYPLAEMYDSSGIFNRSFIAVVRTDSAYHKIFSRYNVTKESLNKYLTTSDSFYYKLMSQYLIDSLPVIDFSKHELVLYAACGQCMVVCDHHGQRNESCHRNACHLQEAWYIRDKKINYIVVNADRRVEKSFRSIILAPRLSKYAVYTWQSIN